MKEVKFLEDLNNEEERVRQEKALEKERSLLAVDRLERQKLETMSNLLTFVQGQLEEDEKRNQLRATVMDSIQELVDDTELKAPPGFLLKILEHLDKSGNERTANVLSILKQNIVINNDTPPSTEFPVPGKSKSTEEEPPDKLESETARVLYDIIHKAKRKAEKIKDAEEVK